MVASIGSTLGRRSGMRRKRNTTDHPIINLSQPEEDENFIEVIVVYYRSGVRPYDETFCFIVCAERAFVCLIQ